MVHIQPENRSWSNSHISKTENWIFQFELLLICRTINKGSVLKYILYILVLESMGMILGGSAFFENHSIFFFWFLLLNKSQDTCICVEGGRVSTQWWLFTYNSSSLEQTYFPHQMVIYSTMSCITNVWRHFIFYQYILHHTLHIIH